MIFRDSLFDGNPWGGGGRKRTAQIGEILSRNGLDTDKFVACSKLTPKSILAAGDNTGHLRVGKRLLTLPLGKERMHDLGNHINECTQLLLDETGGQGCLLWENTRSGNYLTILAAIKAGLSVIALPHNLESLVPNQCSALSGRSAPDCFYEEIAFLALANGVFTISREEQWLLRLHDINSDYLPYFPPRVIVEYLQNIRTRRLRSSCVEGYLLLGTVGNPPTMQGMVEVIRHWPQIGQGRALHVAGFHTERLNEVIEATSLVSANIIIHGTVNNDELVELLVSVQAVILHQPPTTGALTRIPEMLLAGVPLLANRNAARNAHQTTGLHVYEALPELQSLLISADFPIPPPPPEPTEHEMRFVSTIQKMTG